MLICERDSTPVPGGACRRCLPAVTDNFAGTYCCRACLLTEAGSPDLNIGTFLASFQAEGKTPVDKEVLKIIVRGNERILQHLATNSGAISSGPAPLLVDEVLYTDEKKEENKLHMLLPLFAERSPKVIEEGDKGSSRSTLSNNNTPVGDAQECSLPSIAFNLAIFCPYSYHGSENKIYCGGDTTHYDVHANYIVWTGGRSRRLLIAAPQGVLGIQKRECRRCIRKWSQLLDRDRITSQNPEYV
ncbi:hypothetical protein ACJJTC_009194 [Scirpophaga incertulas]